MSRIRFQRSVKVPLLHPIISVRPLIEHPQIINIFQRFLVLSNGQHIGYPVRALQIQISGAAVFHIFIRIDFKFQFRFVHNTGSDRLTIGYVYPIAAFRQFIRISNHRSKRNHFFFVPLSSHFQRTLLQGNANTFLHHLQLCFSAFHDPSGYFGFTRGHIRILGHRHFEASGFQSIRGQQVNPCRRSLHPPREIRFDIHCIFLFIQRQIQCLIHKFQVRFRQSHTRIIRKILTTRQTYQQRQKPDSSDTALSAQR